MKFLLAVPTFPRGLRNEEEVKVKTSSPDVKPSILANLMRMPMISAISFGVDIVSTMNGELNLCVMIPFVYASVDLFSRGLVCHSYSEQ